MSPVPSVWDPPFIDFSSSSDAALSAAIACSNGALLLTGLPCGPAPFTRVRSLFATFASRPELVTRLNAAYAKNYIFKDAHASTGVSVRPHVRKKRTIDLSPSRLEVLKRVDAGVCDELGTDFESAVGFFESVKSTGLPRVLAATADAWKVKSLRDGDVFNYRMVHYYGSGNEEEREEDEENGILNGSRKSNNTEKPGRCGEHRDFGSATLVFQDGIQGLQVTVDNEWRNVQPVTGNVALLQFGWCAMFRSNGGLPAVLHCVVEPPRNSEINIVPDRMAVIFFVAPVTETALDPVVLPGEKTVFRKTTVDDLKTFDGRNWMYREGTIKG